MIIVTKKRRGVTDIMKAIRKRHIADIILIIAAVLLMLPAGCKKAPEKRKGLRKVVVVGSQWYGHIPVWTGMETGMFKEHGFDVEWRFIGKSMDRLNAISSGEAQFASLGEIAMLSAMAQGNKRFYWVGNQDIAPGFEGLVAAKGIKDYADLKGKKIGFPFGSSVDLTARMLLKQNGLDPAKDVRLVNLEVGDVPAAFKAGNVDAALIWEPGFSQLKAEEGATVLGMDTDTEVYRKFGTMTGPDVLIISRKWVDKDTERATEFMRAYFRALRFVKVKPESAVDLVQGKYIQQERELIMQNIKKFVWHDIEDQQRVMTDTGIFGQADYVVRLLHEDIKTIPQKPEFRDWVNLDILPAQASGK
jgi:ABC-type nitrate/sulfonate/bicarbonate transport system substrate-binding protein